MKKPSWSAIVLAILFFAANHRTFAQTKPDVYEMKKLIKAKKPVANKKAVVNNQKSGPIETYDYENEEKEINMLLTAFPKAVLEENHAAIKNYIDPKLASADLSLVSTFEAIRDLKKRTGDSIQITLSPLTRISKSVLYKKSRFAKAQVVFEVKIHGTNLDSTSVALQSYVNSPLQKLGRSLSDLMNSEYKQIPAGTAMSEFDPVTGDGRLLIASEIWLSKTSAWKISENEVFVQMKIVTLIPKTVQGLLEKGLWAQIPDGNNMLDNNPVSAKDSIAMQQVIEKYASAISAGDFESLNQCLSASFPFSTDAKNILDAYKELQEQTSVRLQSSPYLLLKGGVEVKDKTYAVISEMLITEISLNDKKNVELLKVLQASIKNTTDMIEALFRDTYKIPDDQPVITTNEAEGKIRYLSLAHFYLVKQSGTDVWKLVIDPSDLPVGVAGSVR